MSMSATDVSLPESSPAPSNGVAAGSVARTTEEPELVIKARKGWIGVDWRELFSHRELLFFLIWRDVKVKYKQAILGVAWALIVPVISMVLFTFIGKAAGFNKSVPADVPYPVYVYAGL